MHDGCGCVFFVFVFLFMCVFFLLLAFIFISCFASFKSQGRVIQSPRYHSSLNGKR